MVETVQKVTHQADKFGNNDRVKFEWGALVELKR